MPGKGGGQEDEFSGVHYLMGIYSPDFHLMVDFFNHYGNIFPMQPTKKARTQEEAVMAAEADGEGHDEFCVTKILHKENGDAMQCGARSEMS